MAFKKLHPPTIDVSNPQQLQRLFSTVIDNINAEFNRLNKVSILNNTIIENVEINTTTSINHKLGRAPNGYITILKNANVQIWNGEVNETTITLNSSGAVRVSLLIF